MLNLLNVLKNNKSSLKQRQKLQNLTLKKKITYAEKIINKALNKFSHSKSAIAWTGGKDSTLMLWLIKKVASEKNYPLPKIMFVDEGDVFPEIKKFVKKITKEWNLDFSVAHNSDVSSKAKKIGDVIKVRELNSTNRKEIRRLGFKEKEFPFKPESLIGNHLMKTVATISWLKENHIKALFVGVRWDEQEARSEDNFQRKLNNPSHYRIEPILHFTEEDIWKCIHKYKIPYVSLYKKGYRSLGAKSTTQKAGNKPAWKQDLINTKERQGRQQDKEAIMARLRALGYM
jgi:phosphoadenosine phosphosulfate reductase